MAKYPRKRKLPLTPCITRLDAPNVTQYKRKGWSRMLILNSVLLVCVFSGCSGNETKPRISRNNSFVPERIKSDEKDKATKYTKQNIRNDIPTPITRLKPKGHLYDEERINRETEARIIGGHESNRGRYPYIASLTYERGHTCGGSLIADDIILSAAHCYESFDGVDLGRHNVKDTQETYERYVTEKFATHPDYVDHGKPGIAFDNDFMIIKLYGWSKQATVKLNLKPQVPKIEEELTVAGWGVADNISKEPSDVLKEVTVNALSNRQCRAKNGYLNGQLVSFIGRISDNMLCAEDTDEDACQGDSGGPLIVKGLISRLDLQVGVVSWGLGCAHEKFPGVYARLSSQMDWVKEMVCRWSESPPDSFECNKEDRPDQVDGEDGNIDKEAVTVDIMLDRFPKETGWMIRTKDGKSKAYIPIGGYKGVQDKHVFATIHLEVNTHYEFILLDAFGDGLKFDGGNYKLWLGDTPYMGPLLAEGSTFGRSIHYPFYIEKKKAPKTNPPTKSPSIAPVAATKPSKPTQPSTPTEPAPTEPLIPAEITKPPTAAPTKFVPFLTVAIKFDNFPEEVGWAITSDQNELIDSRPIGFYKEKNKLTIERVSIPIEFNAEGIIFAFLDDGQDGLCCDKGQGLFQVFVGPLSDNNLVAKGSKFTRLQHFDINMVRTTSNLNEDKATVSPTSHPSFQPTLPPIPTKKKKKRRKEDMIPVGDKEARNQAIRRPLKMLVMLLVITISFIIIL